MMARRGLLAGLAAAFGLAGCTNRAVDPSPSAEPTADLTAELAAALASVDGVERVDEVTVTQVSFGNPQASAVLHVASGTSDEQALEALREAHLQAVRVLRQGPEGTIRIVAFGAASGARLEATDLGLASELPTYTQVEDGLIR